MIRLTHIYKTAAAGDRQNQTELHINKSDPKFFFTLTAEKPATFKAEIFVSGKMYFHLFDIHERQTKRGIDYLFPLPKIASGEYDALFTISVNKIVIEQRKVQLIIE